MADSDTDTSGGAGRDVRSGIGRSLAGGDSPWAHDGPVPPPSPLPAAWTSERSPDPVSDLAVEPVRADTPAARNVPSGPVDLSEPVDLPGAVDTTAHRRPTRWLLAAGVAGVLVVATIGAQTLGGDGDTTDMNDANDERTPEAEAVPSTTERARPSPVSPSRPTTSPPAETLPEPPPQWATTQVVLDPRLQAMTVPMEIVLMNGAGVVRVIDVPAGVMHSIDTDIGRTSLAMVVGDRAIAVTSYNDGALAIVDLEGGVTEAAVLGGAGQIVARPGSDDFLVSLNNWSGNEPPPTLIVAADGSITEFTDGPVADYDIWALRYIPATGEAVVDDSGGTYAIDAAGAARRITTGDLIAVGQNHLVVRECSEELVCIHFRIDAITGERQLVVVPDFEQQFRGYDPTVSVSPDGTMMTYMNWEVGPLERRLVRLDTGATEEVESNDQYGYGANAGWAADSSGLFVIDGRRLMFHDTTTGEQFEVSPDLDVGGLIAVASRPVAG